MSDGWKFPGNPKECAKEDVEPHAMGIHYVGGDIGHAFIRTPWHLSYFIARRICFVQIIPSANMAVWNGEVRPKGMPRITALVAKTLKPHFTNSMGTLYEFRPQVKVAESPQWRGSRLWD